MALKYKLGTEVEIKSPPEKYYNIFKGQAFHVPNAVPDHIQGVDINEGDWETHGSVKIWKYTMGKAVPYYFQTYTRLNSLFFYFFLHFFFFFFLKGDFILHFTSSQASI